ncbi:TIGR02611 family protein [Actinoplanes octamycinicus]|uniref:TIGR02611 family protein n=1 Tax=Actinoplanes octamycinicus TaxID=135948 RepID=UPI00161A0769|nr:TIGR02611 family protein [Actinoplanes octamycinicus]
MGVKPDDKASDVRLLDRIRSNPSGRLALKIGVGVLGTLVVALGIVLIPFPGPGWAIVILGLAILALEFAWAKNLLEFTKRHVRSWTHWIGRQSLPVRGLIGIVGMIFVAAVVWAAVRLSLGVDLIQWTRDWLAAH